MANTISKIRHKQSILFKVLLAIVAVILIVYIFPKDAKFKYDFQKGKPWLHESLFAPFDFAVYKSDEELNQEKEAITKEAKPYYLFDEQVLETQLNLYYKEFESDWDNSEFGEGSFLKKMFRSDENKEKKEKIKAEHFQIGKDILTAVYKKGIIKIDDGLESKPKDYTIVVVTDNVAEDRDLGQAYTIRLAYDFIQERLNVYENIDKTFLANLLEDLLTHNIVYDKQTSQKVIDEQINSISLTRGLVQRNETIVNRGDIVTDDLYQKLVSLKLEYEKQLGGSDTYYFILAGQTLLVSIALSILMIFILLFRKGVGQEKNKVMFILLLVTLIVYMGAIALSIEQISIYLLPFCILPILIRTFYDTLIATVTMLVSFILIAFIAPNPFEFLFIQLSAGFAAIFTLVSLQKRSQLFSTAMVIFAVYSISYFGMVISIEGELSNISLQNFGWFAGSAVLTLFAYPLLYAFEKLFGFLSAVSLMELSDTNSPLLRQLAEKSPGTFQHSLQVANLAEEAVRHVGGNSLLVRTGALYHDIGKMKNPRFFIENQSGYNPHNDIAPEESGKIIINHVIQGIEMAKKDGLPEQLIDFIRTHHGTSMVYYFYKKHQEQNPEITVDEEKFRYPGPTPFSIETAVLMMADSVEAASRSLKEPTGEALEKLVNGIIDKQTSDGQFANAPITFKDISEIKQLFKQKLMNIYHVRIEYPK